ncbi:MAG: family 16 glycoside hydrolase, partial [Bacteroidales bacterium]
MMKKIGTFLVIILLAGASALYAQDAQRTTATKIGDALNQLPAGNKALFDRLMEDILSTGSEGVMLLAGQIKGDGTSLPQAEYAINGLVQYVSNPQIPDALRSRVAQDFALALEASEDPVVQAFFIRQLALLGREESLDVLSPYLFTKELAVPAVQAVTAIGGEKAVHLLLSAPIQEQTLSGLAQLGSPLAEKFIVSVIKTGDPALHAQAYTALSQCGTMASYDIMEKAPDYEFLRYLERVGRMDPGKTVRALKKRIKRNPPSQVRNQALALLLAMEKDKAFKTVLKALDDKDGAYRRTALEGTRPFLSPVVNGALLKKMKRLSIPAVIDVLDFLGSQNSPALACYIADPWLFHDHPDVAAASARAVRKSGGPESVQLLSGLLTHESALQTQLALENLLSMEGDVVKAVVDWYPKASEQGKTAALTLLGARKARSYEHMVLRELNNPNPRIRMAAAQALSGVAAPGQMNVYFRLLETTAADKDVEPAFLEAVQKAVTAALYGTDAEQAYDVLYQHMQQASPKVQSAYYTPIAATGTKRAIDLLSDKYLESADYKAYIQMLSAWKAPGEQKVIFLRRALEQAEAEEDITALLVQLRNARVVQAAFASAPYLKDSRAGVRLQAALNICRLAALNPHFYGTPMRSWMEQAKEVLAQSDYPDAPYEIKNIDKTLAALPDDAGYVRIFNEKDLEGWQALVGNPISRSKMTPEALAQAQKKENEKAFSQWIVEDGKIIFLGKGDNLCTVKEYGDFEMYIDWLLYPEGPEADAGIYLRGSPQVQIWDTSRVHVGAQVGSGGLYNNIKHMADPTHVADNRLGDWNSFFIRMQGERVTVYLNGDLVVDNVIMENYWDRSQPIFPYGAIELQAHGSKVAYRDIYVRELERPEPYTLSPEEEAQGYEILFDGTSLHKWEGNTTDYHVRDGELVVEPTEQGFGDLYTVKEYGDFIFRFEFKLTPGANNGVGIRAPGTGDAAYEGMEVQILDHFDPIYQ